MDKTKLMQRLMVTFLEELEEHVRSLNQELLHLEKQSDKDRPACLKTLFRSAHSLKGAARAVNVQLIEGACHQLEEILTALQEGKLLFHKELFALLFATVDAIEEAGMRLREQQDLAESPLVQLLERLKAASPRTASVIEATRPEPQESDRPEIEITTSIPTTHHSPHTTHHSRSPDPVQSSLRVSAEKLDNLLARMGELLVARRRLESRLADFSAVQDDVQQWQGDWQRVEKDFEKVAGDVPRHAAQILRESGQHLRRLNKDLERLGTVLAGDNRLLEQTTGPLDEEVHRVRMLPFAEACAGLDRLVRDLTQAEGKEAVLQIQGGGVELDRSILEGLKDPLRHLVRNALDHGVEMPTQRRQAGKPSCGSIVVAAALHGSQVDVVVEDDGGGLDLDALREKAGRLHLPDCVDEQELARLIFLPGFSTAPLITDVSGRGVGLDVVKSRVESLHGTVAVSFQPGKGTRFTLTVPLTLTTLRAVLVKAAGQTYAFAGTNVQRFVRLEKRAIRTLAGRPTVLLSGAPLPFAFLAAVLRTSEVSKTSEVSPTADGKLPVLVVAAGEQTMAFAVDEFVAEQEILIKNLGARIRRMPLVAGATLLPSGRIALVLNAANVVRSALSRPAVLSVPAETRPAPSTRKRVLIVEDSVTTRTLEKSILEAAGYEVATAVDGQAAWQFLQEHDMDLIVSDVEMPHMDGFELTRAIRASKKYQALPVVLVTAREKEQDKERGIAAGADAYLVKSAFDQKNLLETIAQLL
jgi:two-component system chemotaxis sensor kinase CheA